MAAEVHPTAVVHPGTVLGDGVRVLEHAVVGKQPTLSPRSTAKREPLAAAVVGEGTVISTGAIVFAGSTLGARVIVGDQACVRERVEVAASWSGDEVAVSIIDDGPGFAPEIMDRIGEPYVTSRRRERQDGEAHGLGLGFFIAKTLLERSGATLDFENRAFPDRGAVVRVYWGRSDFERQMAFAS